MCCERVKQGSVYNDECYLRCMRSADSCCSMLQSYSDSDRECDSDCDMMGHDRILQDISI